MSFRTRLTSFFVVIVVVPMVAFGFLVFRLISQSETGKADARADGLAAAATAIYGRDVAAARSDASAIARSIASLRGPALPSRVALLASHAGLARVLVSTGGRQVVDTGSRDAVAPGAAVLRGPNSTARTLVTASEATAGQFVRELSAPGIAIVVSQGRIPLSSSLGRPERVPRTGTVSIRGHTYRAASRSFAGFAGKPVEVTVLSDEAATSGSLHTSRVLAATLIGGFLLLALGFALLATRQLRGQLIRFLQAARRVGRGDFTASVPSEGKDEFAALGQEFNRMSDLLARRIDELGEERARLRDLIRRIGQTFAANLDRDTLLRLALETALDGTRAEFGRLSTRQDPDDPLNESARIGALNGAEELVLGAERAALSGDGVGEKSGQELHLAAVALAPPQSSNRVHGVLTVARRGDPFSDDDRDLLRSLANQATLALENVELHLQAQRQAVTDELTGLSNHRSFQELLNLEIEQVRRYGHPVGLIMLDIDDFKQINDTYGHPQGDTVLKQVARVLRESSREVDLPARYGGEELAVVLPHTDLDGAHAIAERIRGAIEALRVPRQDGNGALRVTASLGVAASAAGDKDALIADGDAALYEAKHQGKNRTVTAQPKSRTWAAPGSL